MTEKRGMIGPLTTETVQALLGNRLKPGEMGALMARAGVGKTACLTHFSLERLMTGVAVMHVGVDQSPDKIKLWYDELLRSVAERLESPREIDAVRKQLESLRFIITYVNNTFSPAKLDESVTNLKRETGFEPGLLVLDGLDFEKAGRDTLEELKAFASKQNLIVWASVKTHRHIDECSQHGIPYPCHETEDLFEAIIGLEPASDAIRLSVLKHYARYQPDYPVIILDPRTSLFRGIAG